MAYTFEKGTLNSATYDNYEKNGYYYYTLKINVNGSEITAATSSKSTTFPIAAGTDIIFEIDWSGKKNNRYKGDYYYIKGVKSSGAPKQNNAPQQNNASQPVPATNKTNKDYTLQVLKMAAQKSAIGFISNLCSSGILPSITHVHVYKYTDWMFNNFFNKHQDNAQAAITSMNNALRVMELNNYLEEADLVNTKEKLLALAESLYSKYFPTKSNEIV